VLLGGRGEPAKETSLNMCWVHGGVDVFAFGHGAIFGPITDLFDDGVTGTGAPMQLAAEAAPFRRLCDVHLKPVGAVVLIARSARAS
jgi:hypothetical protein